MTGLEYILSLHEVCVFRSQERGPGPASNSELRRLLDQSALRINGQVVRTKDKVPQSIVSVVLFPKSFEKRITIL